MGKQDSEKVEIVWRYVSRESLDAILVKLVIMGVLWSSFVKGCVSANITSAVVDSTDSWVCGDKHLK